MKALSKKTMSIIVGIIILGFVGMVFNNYLQNRKVYDTERSAITELTNDKIYYEIEGALQLLVERSLMLSSDSSVMEMVIDEIEIVNSGNEEKIEEKTMAIQAMLDRFRDLYNCETVFLVSEDTKHYYSDKGLTNVYVKGEPRAEWYFDLMDQDERLVLNVDFDVSRGGIVTLFVNCKMFDDDGNIIGATGFGITLDSVRDILIRNGEYDDIEAYLVDSEGIINMSSIIGDEGGSNLFEMYNYSKLKDKIILADTPTIDVVSSDGNRNYVASIKIDGTSWTLVTTMRTETFDEALFSILFTSIIICSLIIAIVVYVVRSAMRNYDTQIHNYERHIEQQSKVFLSATANLYEHIFHINITKNTGADKYTNDYFGINENKTFSEALYEKAIIHVEEAYRNKYLETFEPKNIIKNFSQGNQYLEYTIKYRKNEYSDYYWMLIVVYIYKSSINGDICMYSYRKDIDAEVNNELQMKDQAEKDGLTNMYRRMVAQELINNEIRSNPNTVFSFMMIDIDDFKSINDTYGHAFGDEVIIEFSRIINDSFRQNDIIGRIGGDEFCVFTKSLRGDKLKEKVENLSNKLATTITINGVSCDISGSIGVSVFWAKGHTFDDYYNAADKQLYSTKGNGKKGYSIIDAS